MTKELFVSSSPHETKVALTEDDQVVEVYYQRDTDVGLVGGIYKGRVSRVLPGMQSAFVNIGLERDAFLYVSDFLEDAEEYDRAFAEVETRVARYEEAEKGSASGQQQPVLDLHDLDRREHGARLYGGRVLLDRRVVPPDTHQECGFADDIRERD